MVFSRLQQVLAVAALTLGLIGCSGSPDHASGSGTVLLVLGDSLSAGYGLDDPKHGWVALSEAQWRQKGFLARDQTVVNASVSGETSAGGLDRLPELLQTHRPAVVVIELGANDALRRQPMARLSANLEAMIAMSQASGAKVVLVGLELPGLMALAGGGGALEDTYSAVAQAHDVPLTWYPMDDLMGEAGMMQDDRLHPTAAAQPTLVKALSPALERAMGAP